MKKFLTILMAVLIAAFATCSPASAQNSRKDEGGQSKDRWKAEKIAFLTDAMDLTSAEAEKFWPVYNRCEAEKHENFHKMIEAYGALEDAINAGKSDKEISALLDKYIAAQKDGKDIDSKYVSEYRRILPAKKVAKLFIGEEAFRRQQICKLRKDDSK